MTLGKQCLDNNCGHSADMCAYFRAMKLQQLYTAHEGAATSLSFHPSGNFLASGAGDSKVSVEILPPCQDTLNTRPIHHSSSKLYKGGLRMSISGEDL